MRSSVGGQRAPVLAWCGLHEPHPNPSSCSCQWRIFQMSGASLETDGAPHDALIESNLLLDLPDAAFLAVWSSLSPDGRLAVFQACQATRNRVLRCCPEVRLVLDTRTVRDLATQRCLDALLGRSQRLQRLGFSCEREHGELASQALLGMLGSRPFTAAVEGLELMVGQAKEHSLQAPAAGHKPAHASKGT